MKNPGLLRITYVANIFILVPVCFNMLVGSGVGSVFEGKVDESAGLRLLVASLWTAILVASVVGLFRPETMSVVPLIQVFYKSMWLAIFVLPKLLAKPQAPVPAGISIVFLLIVITYPLVYLAAR
jgi:hypothetical protein